MRKYFVAAATLLVVALAMIFPVQAQVLTKTTETQTAPVVTDRPAEISVVPSAFRSFFRDIGQRIELLLTLDSTRDAALRLEFATENLQLVEGIMKLTTDSVAIERAKALAERATVLVKTVNDRENKWSTGDPEALKELSARSQEYFKSAEELVSYTIGLSSDSAWKGSLSDTLDGLVIQNDKTKASLESKIGLTNNLTSQTNLLDKDSDGIDDGDELKLGLSTQDYDTDADGLSDKEEIERFGTDPTKADTDADGYRDGAEVLKGFNPVGSGNFSAAALETNGFVFVKAKLNLLTLSPATLKMLQEANDVKSPKRYNRD